MEVDLELIKHAIKNNPEGHEKLTGRYYLTAQGIKFINASQPKPAGAVRIPSFSDDHRFKAQKINDDQLAELLAHKFIDQFSASL